jgi:hypothetical protein
VGPEAGSAPPLPRHRPGGLPALALLALAPLLWRLSGLGQPGAAGLVSDAASGLLLLLLAGYSPQPLRLVLVWCWALFQGGAQELLAALQRLPVWQDLQYLADADFVGNTAAGLQLSAPALIWTLLGAALWVTLAPPARPRWRWLPAGLALVLVLLVWQARLGAAHDDQPVAARYNALHWLLAEALTEPAGPLPADLPPGLARLDLAGTPLPGGRPGRNLLIVVLEGMPGLYHPEIAGAFGLDPREVSLTQLAAATPGAMLIPDFVAHGHQTIRGLYALLCGDFSKQSWSTPKAVELQARPERAGQCLPAQLARHGWSTHFLQAAGLMFMAKDRLMPVMGFRQVHGSEWFTTPNPYPFDWGVVDAVFFQGAREYIARLRRDAAPWMLTLLTVGTHQPYAVPEALAARYPSRKLATVALLDEAVAEFIAGLRRDGVLRDTLVLITSDESHGAGPGDWVSSWGLGLVLAPEGAGLPRVKQGGYGLVDVTASALDYFRLPQPPDILGRSFFRDYAGPREMVSYTASKRRWHTATGLRYECADDGRCRVGRAASLLGPPPVDFRQDTGGDGARLFAIAAALDRRLSAGDRDRVLEFAAGEIRSLPEQVVNEWSENLLGAQYLDFPAGSRVQVTVRVRVLQAAAEGVRLRLLLKQWEHPVTGIEPPEFPRLPAGGEGRLEFAFDNPGARRSFSFHLLGEGRDARVRLEQFRVQVSAGVDGS